MLTIGCATENFEDETPNDKFLYPIGLKLDKDENYLMVSNSNFDIHYKGASVNVVDLNTKKLEKEKTILTSSFLSNFAYDDELNVFFVLSRESKEIYYLNFDGTKLTCGTSDTCDADYKLDLNVDSPFSISIDKENKLLYVGHRNDGYVSIIKYKTTAPYFELKRQFKINNFSGDVSDIEFNNSDKKVYVSSNYSKVITVFEPVFDINGNISTIRYYDSIYISSKAVLNSVTPSTEDILFHNDKMFLGISNPSSVSILEKSLYYTTENYSFYNDVKLDYFPTKILCINENICVASLYESKKLAIIDYKTEQLINLIDLNKRTYDLVYSQRRKELYTTVFADNGILVVDMDENSSSYLNVKQIIY